MSNQQVANEFVMFAVDVGKKLAVALQNCLMHQQAQGGQGSGSSQSESGSQGALDSGQGEGGSGQSKLGIVRRALDFPSLMLTLGFQPAFTFYLSKLSELKDFRAVYEVYKYLKNDGSDVPNEVCGELRSAEGSGYAGYVAIVLHALGKAGKSVQVDQDLVTLFKNLLDLTVSVTLDDERVLLQYLEEVKKVLEALPYG